MMIFLSGARQCERQQQHLLPEHQVLKARTQLNQAAHCTLSLKCKHMHQCWLAVCCPSICSSHQTSQISGASWACGLSGCSVSHLFFSSAISEEPQGIWALILEYNTWNYAWCCCSIVLPAWLISHCFDQSINAWKCDWLMLCIFWSLIAVCKQRYHLYGHETVPLKKRMLWIIYSLPFHSSMSHSHLSGSHLLQFGQQTS